MSQGTSSFVEGPIALTAVGKVGRTNNVIVSEAKATSFLLRKTGKKDLISYVPKRLMGAFGCADTMDCHNPMNGEIEEDQSPTTREA